MDESNTPGVQPRVLPFPTTSQEEPVIWTNEMQMQLDALRDTRRRAGEQLKKRLGAFISPSTLTGDPELVNDLMLHADKIRAILKKFDPTASSEHMVPPESEDVHWVVTNEGDVGVSIYGRTYVCYKAQSVCVTDVMIRKVDKRELGESLKAPKLQMLLDDIPRGNLNDPGRFKQYDDDKREVLSNWILESKEWQHIANPPPKPPEDTPVPTPNPVHI